MCCSAGLILLCSEESRLNRRRPAVARIVIPHGSSHFGCLFAQIFLVEHAVLANDTHHDFPTPASRGIRDNAKPAGHLSVRDEVLGASLSLVTLLGENQ